MNYFRPKALEREQKIDLGAQLKKLIITGGAGFIGSNFILKQLAETDNHVLNLDKLTYAGNLDNLVSVADNSRYQFVEGDITDAEVVQSVIDEFQPDGIIHFAAESHVDRSIDGPIPFNDQCGGYSYSA